MKKYEYKVVAVKWSPWTGKAKADYLDIINDYGAEGWRFIDFAPTRAHSKKVSGTSIELIFEKEIEG